MPVVKQFGADAADFRKKFSEEAYAQKTPLEFELMEKWSISGFPAAVCETGDKRYLVARGYQPCD